MELTDEIQAVRDDNLSGAQSITHRVGSIVRERIRLVESDTESLKAELLTVGPALINAQPAMAPLFNLFNALLLELDGCADRQDSPTILSNCAEAFSAAMNDHNRAIAQRVCSTIRKGATVFTHSDSSTLRAALQHRRDAGEQFTVVCTESRPACEGSQLAQALSTSGVSTCLVTDSLIFSLLREQRTSSIVLVGADAITTEGIINKAGTSGIAVATQSWGVPFYVLAGSEKFLPAGFFPRGAIQDKPTEEILCSPPEKLRIINRYFDVTPLDSITAVISESGMVTPGAVAKELHQLPVHADLLAVLTDKERVT